MREAETICTHRKHTDINKKMLCKITSEKVNISFCGWKCALWTIIAPLSFLVSMQSQKLSSLNPYTTKRQHGM